MPNRKIKFTSNTTMASDYNHNFSHNKTTLHNLRMGDLVEFKRGLYSHWGVYIGNGEIVHLAGEDDDGIDGVVEPKHVFTICGKQFDKAKVCIDQFWKVVGKDKAIKNNDKDHKWTPLDPEQIVQNALSKLGEVGYSIIYKNCEHFAKWCRYGMEKSDQVENVVTGAAVAIAGGLVIGLVHAIAKYWGGSTEEDENEEETHQRSKRRQNAHLHPTSG